MFREVLYIVGAILLSRPDMPADEAERYARVLQEEAEEHHFDPLSGVSIIHHESGWRPDAVSRSGEDLGLAQIRARYVGACKDDSDPVHNPGKACRKVKDELLDPEANIRKMAELITHNRAVCKKKTGSAKFHQWLASYQGRNYPKKKQWCRPGKKTWAIIKYRRWLIDELQRNPPEAGASEKAQGSRDGSR